MSTVKRQIINEIHKPARVNFQRRITIIKSLNDLFQADLIDVQNYSDENKGYKYILVVINCFSKFLWAFPLKTKSGVEVTKNMEQVFRKQKPPPKNLQTDMGTEFYNSYENSKQKIWS